MSVVSNLCAGLEFKAGGLETTFNVKTLKNPRFFLQKNENDGI